MDPDRFRLLPLVEKREFFEDCINILNEEWPRSLTLRLRSMEKCLNPKPPMSLVFIDLTKNRAVGHVRICDLPSNEDSCWIESVVVAKARRRTGLGVLLMRLLEDKISELGYRKIYLSTRDKDAFYRKCGYSPTSPVLNIGAHSKILDIFPLVVQKSNELTKSPLKLPDRLSNKPTNCLPGQLPPPPPPPPPITGRTQQQSKILADELIYMCKSLS